MDEIDDFFRASEEKKRRDRAQKQTGKAPKSSKGRPGPYSKGDEEVKDKRAILSTTITPDTVLPKSALPKSKQPALLRFRGSRDFRARVVYSTLSGKGIRIDDIRADDQQPGLRDYEVSFLRLMEKITNGTSIQINTTGTSLKYKPGMLWGGAPLQHDCPNSRSIGYYLESLMALAPFAKKALSITLTGITNEDKDTSVDIIRTVTIPLLKNFGVDESIDLKIKKRGAAPDGGGEVLFKCPIVASLKPCSLTDPGMIKRIRGVAFTTRCSVQFGNRMVESARGILNNFIPDVYIYTDHYKGKDSGNSPGFAVSLVAESTTGSKISSEIAAKPGDMPEDIGKQCAKQLCEEIARGGVVDSTHQSLAFLLMLLCPEDISKIRVGTLSPQGIQSLRLFREFFGVTFKIKPEPETKTVLLSCLGVGFKNFSRKTLA